MTNTPILRWKSGEVYPWLAARVKWSATLVTVVAWPARLPRLLAAMEELGMVEKVATPAPVFILLFDAERLHDYLKLAAVLRAAGIGVEVFPEAKKLGQQLKYADRRGFRVALIAGEDEFNAGTCQVKDLQKAQQQDVPLESDAASVIAAVKQILGS